MNALPNQPGEPRHDNAGGQPGEVGKANSTQQVQFYTDNPRHQRALALLRLRPAKREEIDSRVGCSNGPELVAELRRRGLEVPCKRIECLDRDGRPCRPGIYSLTAADRRQINRWIAERAKGGGNAS